jgi:ABC-type multidrug transport system ATPase subunit
MILDLIRRLKARGDVSVIIVAHNYAPVFDASDRVNLLQNGRITFDQATKDTSVEVLLNLVLHEIREARETIRKVRRASSLSSAKKKATVMKAISRSYPIPSGGSYNPRSRRFDRPKTMRRPHFAVISIREAVAKMVGNSRSLLVVLSTVENVPIGIVTLHDVLRLQQQQSDAV